MRLGDAHGACPLAGPELGQIGLFLLIAAARKDGLKAAGGQAGVERERHVGRAQHLLNHLRDEIRQPLAAELRWVGQTHPAGLPEQLVGLFHALRQSHLTVLPLCADGIAGLIEWRDLPLNELGGLVEQSLDEIGRRVFERINFGQLIDVKHVIEDKAHLAQRCRKRCHRGGSER